jgi:signal transduction histidine kinase
MIITDLIQEHVQIVISDNGCAIESKHLSVDSFFTTKDPGEGTGLELFIAHQLIKEHKGHITFDSESGIATEVFIYLPAFIIENVTKI